MNEERELLLSFHTDLAELASRGQRVLGRSSAGAPASYDNKWQPSSDESAFNLILAVFFLDGFWGQHNRPSHGFAGSHAEHILQNDGGRCAQDDCLGSRASLIVRGRCGIYYSSGTLRLRQMGRCGVCRTASACAYLISNRFGS